MNELQYKQGKFQTNSAIHSTNLRREYHVHRQVSSCSSFQKSTYYLGSKYSTVYHAHSLEWKHSISISIEKVFEYTHAFILFRND